MVAFAVLDLGRPGGAVSLRDPAHAHLQAGSRHGAHTESNLRAGPGQSLDRPWRIGLEEAVPISGSDIGGRE